MLIKYDGVGKQSTRIRSTSLMDFSVLFTDESRFQSLICTGWKTCAADCRRALGGGPAGGAAEPAVRW